MISTGVLALTIYCTVLPRCETADFPEAQHEITLHQGRIISVPIKVPPPAIVPPPKIEPKPEPPPKAPPTKTTEEIERNRRYQELLDRWKRNRKQYQ